MMNELILQQQVNRRTPPAAAPPPKPQKAGAYTVLPQGQNNLMTQIKQQPAPVQRYYKKKEPELPVIHLPRSAPPPPIIDAPIKPLRQKQETSLDQESLPPRKPAGITRFTIIALGSIALFAFLALNWSQLMGAFKVSMLPGGVYHLEPGADLGIQENLANYAGLNPPAAEEEEEEIPLNMIETFAWEEYTVKKGDNISKIAANFSISMDAVIASNNISRATLLKVGEVLRIPNMDGIPYTVKPGDSLSKISKNMGVPLEVILDANDIQSDNILPKTALFIPGAKMRKDDLKLVLGELFIYPIRGRLTSPFGWRNDPISGVRRYHGAVDLAASTGTPVKAAMEGRISTVGLNSVYGKYIIITHNDGYQTMYAHLSATSVTQGSYVHQGTKIGEVGSTGYSTGPHLHFALYKNGRAINPLDFLKS
ncbi:MAG: M23 family metallopeptidase [Spirochaetaceae bacterium]|jgi:murein DD-endopeptidase MepM/ murein hydrolase activator NlpD|nr:M23 family metallopeptidase [Spirochaetaceae bacterium]